MGNTIFPTLPGLTWDVTKSPRWNTRVQQSVSLKETRVAYASAPVYRWQLQYELLRASAASELQTLIGFFNARQGQFDSFLYADPSDSAVTAHGFGVGDGSTTSFQLQRTLAGPRALDWRGVYPTYTTPRRNDWTFTEDISNAAYTKTGGVVVSNSAYGPDRSPAKIFNEDTSTGGHFYSRATPTFTPGVAQGLSIDLRSNARPKGRLYLSNTDFAGVTYDLDAGTITPYLGGVGQLTYSRIVAHPGGFYRIEFAAIVNGTASNATFVHTLADASGATTYTGAGGIGVIVTAAQFEVNGGQPTRYMPNLAGSTPQVVPAYWSPTAPMSADGFEPVYELNGAPSLIAVAGVPKAQVSEYTVSSTGAVTFATAPAAGAALTWSGSYFWRVRFEQDTAEFNQFLYQLWELKQVALVSVKV